MEMGSSTTTNGAGFGPEAMPLQDLAADANVPFDVRDGKVYLRGSVSRSSGSKAFPARAVCHETGARDMEPMYFGPQGVLYSFSTVHVSSSRPTPYTIGYVDFDNGVRILAAVQANGVPLHCDMPVQLQSSGGDWFVSPIAAQGGQA